MKHFSELLGVSRPTMYKMISDYENGKLNSEPYVSVFNAFFLKERNAMKGNYKMCNGNLMVRIVENTAMNANGTVIKNSETRGKRDVVCGVLLVNGDHLKEGDLIYFSYYAGQPMQLEDEQVYIVNYKDIKFINTNIRHIKIFMCQR